MTRDYKNINRKKPEKKSRYQSLVPFITGLSIGLFVAFIVYIKEHQSYGDNVLTPEFIIDNKKSTATAEPADSQEQDKIPEPKFDFYQILPSMEVNVSEWEAEETKKDDPIADNSGLYILQVGSFEQYEAADEIKAKLALLGINADIQRVVINGRDIRHRVRVGPYKDPAKLQEARERLLVNNLDFMLLKLQVDDI
jgi:cell division protein FtsN